MRLLLDEMYSPALVEALRRRGVDAATACELGLAGSSDPDLLAAAAAQQYVLLTENVADFARASAELLLSGGHHAGVLVALSSRFSRRPREVQAIAEAVAAVCRQDLRDRVVYLERPPSHQVPLPG